MLHLTLLLAAPLLQQPLPPPLATAAEPRLLERVCVVGASMSAGFGLRREAGRRVDLTELLDRAIVAEHGPIHAGGSQWIFLDPKKHGTRMVEDALATEPTLLFALDFLFWFAYGDAVEEGQRAALFELGLALLDRFSCPLVVGDLPDMRPALDAKTPMLLAAHVPRAETLKQLNRRLAAWAKERPRVAIVPWAGLVRSVFAGEKFELRGNTWDEHARERAMQADLLHPTVWGTFGVLVLALDSLVGARAEVGAEAFRWDIDRLAAEILPPAETPEGG